MYLKTFFIYTVQLSNEPSSLSFVCLVRAANKGLRGCVGLYVLHGCLPYPITDKKIAFPIGILGQVRYLIVSIPDLCTLTYFDGILLNTYYICFHYIVIAQKT